MKTDSSPGWMWRRGCRPYWQIESDMDHDPLA
jgi:hypothetical protein